MSELVVTTFVTVDGVMQAPGGREEDTGGEFEHGGWVMPHFDDETGAFMVSVFERPAAFLLGRRTYEIFATYWPKVTDENDPIAAKLNALPKYVASRTLQSADWGPATIVSDVPAEVAALKEQVHGELQVHGSANLIQSLLEHDLVDRHHILTFPAVLGTGKRLFEAGAPPSGLHLVGSRATGSGVVISTYERAGEPRYEDVPPAS